jgi:CheY-like chemotaxis protein/anti-sigma regulatory factor (Ser/Thr protein kinase)
MRKEHVALSSVIERAIETAQPALTRRRQVANVDSDEPVWALVDATRIAQIVGNLLNNASKHSPVGAPVRVQLRRDGDAAVIRVIDEGVGIPSDQLTRVFDMFTKIERSAPGTNDGLGIGLALSRQLAELHGGTLTALSGGEGMGATFSLSVPIGAPAPAVDAAPPNGAKAPAASSSALTIVVVEDNEDSADMLATWLEALGHAVRVAHTGAEGLALVLEVRPDIVLCDIGLPGMDGIDVCRRIALGMEPPPVMVALTGWGMGDDRKRTREAGFNHHLVKPVALDKLQTVLESVRANGAR